jgi:hypothetical protein
MDFINYPVCKDRQNFRYLLRYSMNPNGIIYGSETCIKIRLGICGFVALDIYLCLLFLNGSAVWYATHLSHALYSYI